METSFSSIFTFGWCQISWFSKIKGPKSTTLAHQRLKFDSDSTRGLGGDSEVNLTLRDVRAGCNSPSFFSLCSLIEWNIRETLSYAKSIKAFCWNCVGGLACFFILTFFSGAERKLVGAPSNVFFFKNLETEIRDTDLNGSESNRPDHHVFFGRHVYLYLEKNARFFLLFDSQIKSSRSISRTVLVMNKVEKRMMTMIA
jgi:hypothetical protein